MRQTRSRMLSDAQAERLETRRKELRRSRRLLQEKFAAALRAEGVAPALSSIKMRLDRVLNRRMRRPTSEATLRALASALDWTLLELEAALQDVGGATGETINP